MKKHRSIIFSCAALVILLTFSAGMTASAASTAKSEGLSKGETRTFDDMTVSEIPKTLKASDGRTLYLDAESVVETSTVREPASTVLTWQDCRFEPDIPKTVPITAEDAMGRHAEVTGYLSRVETVETGRTSDFTIEAAFIGDADSPYYIVNGKYVPAAEVADGPDFEGYQQELLSCLGLDPAVCKVTGARWVSDFTVDEATGKTVRRAEFTAAAANLCDYEAYYTEADFSEASPLYAVNHVTARYVPAADNAAGTGQSSGTAGGAESAGTSGSSGTPADGSGTGTGDAGSGDTASGSAGSDNAGTATGDDSDASAAIAPQGGSSGTGGSGGSAGGQASGGDAAGGGGAGGGTGQRGVSSGSGLLSLIGHMDAQTAAAFVFLAAAVLLFIFSRRRPIHAGRGGKGR